MHGPHRIDFDEVRRTATGRWDAIYRSLAPELVPAIARAPRHVPCPVHGGKDGFRLFRDWNDTGGGFCNTCSLSSSLTDGFRLLCWLRGWDIKRAFEEIAAFLGMRPGATSVPVIPRAPITPKVADPAEGERRLTKLRATWDESVALDHPLAEPARRYIQCRGLAPLRAFPEALRFHPMLPFWVEVTRADGKKRWMMQSEHPALLGVMTDPGGRALTMHRIYLDPNGGKADVEEVKKLMLRPEDWELKRAAIRLAPAGRVLSIAEGIETALAVMEITGQPCWACYSSTIMQSFEPPPGVDMTFVWADKDRKRAGEIAAEHVVERLRALGRRAIALVPGDPIPEDKKSVDWLDVLVERKRQSSNVRPLFRELLARVEVAASGASAAGVRAAP